MMPAWSERVLQDDLDQVTSHEEEPEYGFHEELSEIESSAAAARRAREKIEAINKRLETEGDPARLRAISDECFLDIMQTQQEKAASALSTMVPTSTGIQQSATPQSIVMAASHAQQQQRFVPQGTWLSASQAARPPLTQQAGAGVAPTQSQSAGIVVPIPTSAQPATTVASAAPPSQFRGVPPIAQQQGGWIEVRPALKQEPAVDTTARQSGDGGLSGRASKQPTEKTMKTEGQEMGGWVEVQPGGSNLAGKDAESHQPE